MERGRAEREGGKGDGEGKAGKGEGGWWLERGKVI